MTAPDPWAIADDLDDLVDAWDPATVTEAPSAALDPTDRTWVMDRIRALEFVRAERADLAAMFDTETARLTERRAAMVGPLDNHIARLEHQLHAMHAAVLGLEASAGTKLSTTIKTPAGALRSGAGQVTVTVTDEAAAVDWLRTNGFTSAVKTTVTVKVDRRAAAKHVHVDSGGSPVGIVNPATGELCPGVDVVAARRWFKTPGE